MKQKNVKNQGITLIALVITIIVLLILAAVSIATLTGENGILTKATKAKKNTQIEEEKEQIRLAYTAALADNPNALSVSKDNLETELQKLNSNISVENGENSGSFTIIFSNSGRSYILDNQGNISNPNEQEGNVPPTPEKDVTAPNLELSSISNLKVDLNKWEYTNNAKLQDDIIDLPEINARALSDYFKVDGGEWKISFEFDSTVNFSKDNTDYGAYRMNSLYYDKEKDQTKNRGNYLENGNAGYDTEKEYTSASWKSGYHLCGENIEYVKFDFVYDNITALGPYKVKNIKVTSTGNYSNLSKTITAKASDEKGISSLKWLKGDQTEEAFETGGTEFKDSFDVEENDVYTICATDTSGNKTIKKITISGIEKE